ncbi:GGDEF domain-containing response regulator [Pseudoalteromonas sp. S16_S37]|uniref:GGDEF domain-containing response regulator n=1 Tax=Pseudoalteromonas sp. S16_S37 TaxID=2720228 RepID=UPI0016801D5E|nr:diguanylate cyclase [Pseudoalteromonas sp. S16_S37]MBD1581934.1 diguanylate cyclase [Pseudoalteromonas sp. S16_S37]
MRANILVVEDDDINFLVIQKILSSSYIVERCVSGYDCIKFCEAKIPDVILMDVEMPGLNGLETCKALKNKESTKDIPVIFVTSHHEDNEQTMCWQAGGSDFVIKPVNALTLQHRVDAQVKLQSQYAKLKSMAFIDGLTQVYNRHYLTSELEKRLSYAKRNGTAFSLFMADIDRFKKYNDFYGHLKGDECLKQVAQLIETNHSRGEDAVVRYGGEEFVCIMPQVDKHGLETLTSKLKQRIENASIPHDGSPFGRITLSIGGVYSNVVSDANDQKWLQVADEQLYISKESGRNCVTIKEL